MKVAIAFVAAIPLLASAADDSVAVLTRIDGSVLVSTGQSIASVAQPVRLSPGMRVLTALSSYAEITFDDGCHVKLGPGERFEVDHEPPCAWIPVAEPESRPTEHRR